MNNFIHIIIGVIFMIGLLDELPFVSDRTAHGEIDNVNYTEQYVVYMFETLNIEQKETTDNIRNIITEHISDVENIHMGAIPLYEINKFENKWKAHTLLNPVVHGAIIQDWTQGKSLEYTIIEIDDTFIIVMKIQNIIIIAY